MIAACAMLDYWKEHGHFPTLTVLGNRLQDVARQKQNTDLGVELIQFVQKLSTLDTRDVDAYKQDFIKFVRVTGLRNKMLDINQRLEDVRKPVTLADLYDLEKIYNQTEVKSQTQGLSIPQLATMELPDDCLLGAHRWLCRGGSCLLTAPTGIGKTSTIIQWMANFSCGKEAFGIKPARPLKMVVIQAENDEGDMHENSVSHQDVSDEDWKLMHNNTLVIYHSQYTGEDFIGYVARVLREHRPDILIIDPLNSYLGGDVSRVEVVAKFCRNGLNPLLHEYGCACIIVHHVNKPKSDDKDQSKWLESDYSYNFAGSADLINWARAMITISSTANPNVFRFKAGKRGKRLGWLNADGQPTTTKYFSHEEDRILWRESTEEEIALTQAMEDERNSRKKSRGGRAETYTEDQVTSPLVTGKALTVAEWLKALHKLGIKISQAALYSRIGILSNAEQITKQPDGKYRIRSRRNPVTSDKV